jgi:hypothetical protein
MGNVFTALDCEWERLASSRAIARRLPDVCRTAGGARTLAEVQRYVRRSDPAEADQVLLALVARAIEGDDLAARALLQLLLPGTRSLARRWWALGDRDERAAAAVAAVYQRIRRYPLDRRPGRVAANVLMDAARDLRNAVPRPDAPATEPRPDERAAPVPHPGVELTEVLCDAVHEGVLAPAEASLIARSRIAGHRLSELSADQGIPERTLFAHRQRAERRLATAYARGQRLSA